MTAVGWAHVSFGILLIFMSRLTLLPGLSGVCLLTSGAMFWFAGTFARRHRRWAIWLGIGTAGLLVVATALMLMLFGVTELRRTPADVLPEFAPPSV